MKYVGYFLLGLLIVVVLSFFGNALGLFNLTFWESKREDARREIFENTQSYVEAKRQELLKYYTEYREAKSTEDSAAIKFMVQQSFANVDDSKFTGELGKFLNEMKYK